MPSQINPSLIDPSFPVSGVNNSVQGFRSNFLGTQNGLKEAALELTDLMNKVIVSAPLTNGANVVYNNFSGMPITNAVLSNNADLVFSHGILTASSTENIDFTLGKFHEINLSGLSLPVTTTLVPINFPNLGYSELTLYVTVSNTIHNLSFNRMSIINASSIAGYNTTANTLNFSSVGPHTLSLGSVDGINWLLVRKTNVGLARNYTPTNSYGIPSDSPGQIAYDANYIYVCTGNYDGITPIWQRSALTTF